MRIEVVALLATLFTLLMTALGASVIFFFKKVNNKVMALMYGFSAGVMLSASFFSLILPGITAAKELNQISYLVVGGGFLLGGVFILLIDLFLPKEEEGKVKPRKKYVFNKQSLLILAITLHNIPEGLAIGVAFACCYETFNMEFNALIPGLILTLGIGIQNFPEGLVVSLPLRTKGVSRIKAFLWGASSGIVEPIGALIGVLLVQMIKQVLPFVLGFTSGAMLYVVVTELIPASQNEKIAKWGTMGFLVGFFLMMVLDLVFN